MSFSISDLNTIADLQALIGTQEHIRLEFKSSKLFYDFKTGSPQKRKSYDALSKEISGFANTEGGLLIVGIETKRIDKEPDTAVALDDGLAFRDYSPETVQRAVEASISPPIPGIRFKPIRSSDSSRYYLVVDVPKGYTAHQANDRIYYGRAEYETAPLHDSVVRLLMTRASEPHATLHIPKVEENKDFSRPKYQIEVGVENDGELNIDHFKLELKVIATDFRLWVSPDRTFENTPYLFKHGETLVFRDGYPAPEGSSLNPRNRSHFGSSSKTNEPISVSVFPGEYFPVAQYEFSIWYYHPNLTYEDHIRQGNEAVEESLLELSMPADEIAEKMKIFESYQEPEPEKRFELEWRIYLPNTRAIEGVVNLAELIGLDPGNSQ